METFKALKHEGQKGRVNVCMCACVHLHPLNVIAMCTLLMLSPDLVVYILLREVHASAILNGHK